MAPGHADRYDSQSRREQRTRQCGKWQKQPAADASAAERLKPRHDIHRPARRIPHKRDSCRQREAERGTVVRANGRRAVQRTRRSGSFKRGRARLTPVKNRRAVTRTIHIATAKRTRPIPEPRGIKQGWHDRREQQPELRAHHPMDEQVAARHRRRKQELHLGLRKLQQAAADRHQPAQRGDEREQQSRPA